MASSLVLSPWDHVQYRLLRKFFPVEGTHMDGSAYAGKSKVRSLLGDEILGRLASCQTVVDFGCGSGEEAVELATLGCKHVIGVDIRPNAIREAQERAVKAGVADKCTFTTEAPSAAESILSLDSFEHFDDPGGILRIMHSMLRPGGRVYTSFGPTWYHPLGGHLFSIFPWAHVVFSESALCAWRSHIRSDGAARFNEVEGGLNQMTIGRFEKLVKESPFRLESMECIPIRKLASVHSGVTREFTTALVRAVLLRPS